MDTAKLKLSYSRGNTYTDCSMRYKLHYIDKLRSPLIRSFLPFGSAIDKTLNYVLEAIRDGKPYHDYIIRFEENWSKFEHNGVTYDTRTAPNLEYLKSDLVEALLTEEQLTLPHQEKCYYSLLAKGRIMLSAYVRDFVPKIKKVLSVQHNTELSSGDGTKLIGVVDFVAELEGFDEPVVIDNKTASSKYPKNSVASSPQLASYCYALGLKRAAYVVMLKKFESASDEGQVQFLCDEITQETMEKVISSLEDIAQGINEGVFEKNWKSCGNYFGAKCPYVNLCKNGSTEGLIKV